MKAEKNDNASAVAMVYAVIVKVKNSVGIRPAYQHTQFNSKSN